RPCRSQGRHRTRSSRRAGSPGSRSCGQPLPETVDQVARVLLVLGERLVRGLHAVGDLVPGLDGGVEEHVRGVDPALDGYREHLPDQAERVEVDGLRAAGGVDGLLHLVGDLADLVLVLAEPVEVDLDVTLGHQYPLCMIEPPPKSSSSSGRGRAGRAGGGGAGAGGGGGGGGSSACSAFNSHRGVSAAGSSAISGAGICSSRKCIAALSVPINGAITVLSCWAAWTCARCAVATTAAARRGSGSSCARGPKASCCSAPLVLTVTVTAPSALVAVAAICFRRSWASAARRVISAIS